ncbi:MAG: tol-pal system protein YbgF [Syntrophobacterales bacterium]|nr:MAG: tol-pal system protein YbgF [Syntrophobacterales bacterium]
MKRSLILIIILVVISLAGCATQNDMNVVKMNTYALQTELSELKKTVVANKESAKTVGKSQADVGADIIDLRQKIQELRGITEEVKVKTEYLETGNGGDRLKGLSDDLNDVEARVAIVENYLGIGKKETATEKEAGTTPLKESIDKEQVYSEAYRTFKDGKYGSAREKFGEFLKSFSDTEYSDNAQFWIGECYYFEEKYEKAILEYEKVVQNYPKGNKVPNALLKQALSFLKLDDTSSSRLLLQRVIKEYPNTNAARIARAKLVDIK